MVDKQQQSYASSAPYIAPYAPSAYVSSARYAPSAYVSSTTYVSSARYAPSAYVSTTAYVSSARYAPSAYVSSARYTPSAYVSSTAYVSSAHHASSTYVSSTRYASSAPTRRTSSTSLVVGHRHTANNRSPADAATEFRAGFGRESSSEPEATSSDRGFCGHANKRQIQASRFRLRCCEFGADGPNLGHKNSSLMILW
jgi:hypothetical protein